MFTACVPSLVEKTANKEVPANFHNSQDTLPDFVGTQKDTMSSAQINWKDFFTDPYLNNLIEIGLENNQELNITLQEIQISQNEVRARKGEYLPYIGLQAGGGIEKAAKYTRDGAVEENLNIRENEAFPDPLPDYKIGAYATWEIDVWNKLHNAKKASVFRYLSSVEGKNFMVTHLIAEIANSYYELLALDNQLEIIHQNINIQSNALRIVKLQKQAARATELAVQRFEAEVAKTKSLQYDIQQQIVETENRINFLFLFISLLEESGYMSRVVFLMDRIMRRFGLSGKSVVPLVSGTACAIPAIMATRNIENWKERLITILVTPFTTCSARLPVYLIIISLVIPDERVLYIFNLQSLVLMLLYLIGFGTAILSAWLLDRILKIKSRTFFVIEMPNY
ncbi:nucleoside recognition domain-containing protein, partial [Mesonia mobilis]|uniref:nucleoside recognition domain-containing protein n=1 Tax=Mesonia mobilis TaxID=369791 RepID=UPI0026F37743